jgi:DNA-binding ferritin-like protein
MEWSLRSRPAYIGEYESMFPIPLPADKISDELQMSQSGKPPMHKGSLAQKAKQLKESVAIMADESESAATRGDEELSEIAEELADRYETQRQQTMNMMKTIKEKGIMGKGRKTRRASTRGGNLIESLLTIRNQIKVYHWQTKEFARHKATDDLVASLDTNIDSFVEVYMGKYGRPNMSTHIKTHNFSESAARSFVVQQTKFLTHVLPRKLKSSDTDLLNVRDEILADLNKTLYLFTLA